MSRFIAMMHTPIYKVILFGSLMFESLPFYTPSSTLFQLVKEGSPRFRFRDTTAVSDFWSDFEDRSEGLCSHRRYSVMKPKNWLSGLWSSVSCVMYDFTYNANTHWIWQIKRNLQYNRKDLNFSCTLYNRWSWRFFRFPALLVNQSPTKSIAKASGYLLATSSG